MSEKVGCFIGIDIGSLNTGVAVFEDSASRILYSRQSGKKIPSYILTDQTEKLFGEFAKDNLLIDPEHTIFCAKAFIGCDLEKSLAIKDKYRLPFAVEKHDEEHVLLGGKTGVFPADTIRALLDEVREIVKDKLDDPAISATTITYPAQFNEKQRGEIKNIAQSSGFTNVECTNESLLALWGCIQHAVVKGNRVMVFNFGAVFSEMKLFKTSVNNTPSPRSLFDRNDIGVCGFDFDMELVRYCREEFEKESHIDVFRSGAHAVELLRQHCQKAKQDLSAGPQAAIFIQNFVHGISFRLILTKDKFEKICANVFDRLRQTLADIIGDIKEKHPIETTTDIILVGGTARIPKIREIFLQVFGRKPNSAVLTFADDAAVLGAAFRASCPVNLPPQISANDSISDSPTILPYTQNENPPSPSVSISEPNPETNLKEKSNPQPEEVAIVEIVAPARSFESPMEDRKDLINMNETIVGTEDASMYCEQELVTNVSADDHSLQGGDIAVENNGENSGNFTEEDVIITSPETEKSSSAAEADIDTENDYSDL